MLRRRWFILLLGGASGLEPISEVEQVTMPPRATPDQKLSTNREKKTVVSADNNKVVQDSTIVSKSVTDDENSTSNSSIPPDQNKAVVQNSTIVQKNVTDDGTQLLSTSIPLDHNTTTKTSVSSENGTVQTDTTHSQQSTSDPIEKNTAQESSSSSPNDTTGQPNNAQSTNTTSAPSIQSTSEEKFLQNHDTGQPNNAQSTNTTSAPSIQSTSEEKFLQKNDTKHPNGVQSPSTTSAPSIQSTIEKGFLQNTNSTVPSHSHQSSLNPKQNSTTHESSTFLEKNAATHSTSVNPPHSPLPNQNSLSVDESSAFLQKNAADQENVKDSSPALIDTNIPTTISPAYTPHLDNFAHLFLNSTTHVPPSTNLTTPLVLNNSTEPNVEMDFSGKILCHQNPCTECHGKEACIFVSEKSNMKKIYEGYCDEEKKHCIVDCINKKCDEGIQDRNYCLENLQCMLGDDTIQVSGICNSNHECRAMCSNGSCVNDKEHCPEKFPCYYVDNFGNSMNGACNPEGTCAILLQKEDCHKDAPCIDLEKNVTNGTCNERGECRYYCRQERSQECDCPDGTPCATRVLEEGACFNKTCGVNCANAKCQKDSKDNPCKPDLLCFGSSDELKDGGGFCNGHGECAVVMPYGLGWAQWRMMNSELQAFGIKRLIKCTPNAACQTSEFRDGICLSTGDICAVDCTGTKCDNNEIEKNPCYFKTAWRHSHHSWDMERKIKGVVGPMCVTEDIPYGNCIQDTDDTFKKVTCIPSCIQRESLPIDSERSKKNELFDEYKLPCHYKNPKNPCKKVPEGTQCLMENYDYWRVAEGQDEEAIKNCKKTNDPSCMIPSKPIIGKCVTTINTLTCTIDCYKKNCWNTNYHLEQKNSMAGFKIRKQHRLNSPGTCIPGLPCVVEELPNMISVCKDNYLCLLDGRDHNPCNLKTEDYYCITQLPDGEKNDDDEMHVCQSGECVKPFIPKPQSSTTFYILFFIFFLLCSCCIYRERKIFEEANKSIDIHVPIQVKSANNSSLLENSEESDAAAPTESTNTNLTSLRDLRSRFLIKKYLPFRMSKVSKPHASLEKNLYLYQNVDEEINSLKNINWNVSINNLQNLQPPLSDRSTDSSDEQQQIKKKWGQKKQSFASMYNENNADEDVKDTPTFTRKSFYNQKLHNNQNNLEQTVHFSHQNNHHGMKGKGKLDRSRLLSSNSESDEQNIFGKGKGNCKPHHTKRKSLNNIQKGFPSNPPNMIRRGSYEYPEWDEEELDSLPSNTIVPLIPQSSSRLQKASVHYDGISRQVKKEIEKINETKKEEYPSLSSILLKYEERFKNEEKNKNTDNKSLSNTKQYDKRLMDSTDEKDTTGPLTFSIGSPQQSDEDTVSNHSLSDHLDQLSARKKELNEYQDEEREIHHSIPSTATFTPEHPVPWAIDAEPRQSNHPEVFTFDSDSDINENIDDYMDFPPDYSVSSPHRSDEQINSIEIHDHHIVDGSSDMEESSTFTKKQTNASKLDHKKNQSKSEMEESSHSSENSFRKKKPNALKLVHKKNQSESEMEESSRTSNIEKFLEELDRSSDGSYI